METNKLVIISPSFENKGKILRKHTGFAQDVSPEFRIKNLSEETASIAIIMDDLDVPMMDEFNHWVIWNIPKTNIIPENIPYGSHVTELGGAVQGVGFGKNRYRGPKQPFFIKTLHRYVFHIYALDSLLDLPASANKKVLKKAMEGHILQEGSIMGTYKRGE